MPANDRRPEVDRDRRGRLAIVGTGIMAVAQMSLETISYIRSADVVFYHATNGITAAQIHKLNRNAFDLYTYYGEGKERKITYVQMAELMLQQVRDGLSVVGVFHGHPGYFVSPARRALAIAAMEGYSTALLPAISAPDCMFADLRVDPGIFGCQVMMASRVFAKNVIVATTGHVVFLQVSAVGDSGFSFSGYRNAKLQAFFDCLIALYGEEHEAVYYMAAVFPGLAPEISVRKLKDYRSSEGQASIHAGMLYLPPQGVSFASLEHTQAFLNGNAYGPFEKRAVAELATHTTPAGFVSRQASKSLLAAMIDLVTDKKAMDEYRRNPEAFASRFPNLAAAEKDALISQDAGSLRAVTTR